MRLPPRARATPWAVCAGRSQTGPPLAAGTPRAEMARAPPSRSRRHPARAHASVKGVCCAAATPLWRRWGPPPPGGTQSTPFDQPLRHKGAPVGSAHCGCATCVCVSGRRAQYTRAPMQMQYKCAAGGCILNGAEPPPAGGVGCAPSLCAVRAFALARGAPPRGSAAAAQCALALAQCAPPPAHLP